MLKAGSKKNFKKKRMDDKIGFLKDYIPDFLFQHKKIYSVLSKGLHEMSEEECLKYFDVLKNGIIVIIEEENRKEEEKKSKERLSDAINKL